MAHDVTSMLPLEAYDATAPLVAETARCTPVA